MVVDRSASPGPRRPAAQTDAVRGGVHERLGRCQTSRRASSTQAADGSAGRHAPVRGARVRPRRRAARPGRRARSWSPTASSTTSRSRPPRSASRRRCTRSSPATTASATGASRSSRRAALRHRRQARRDPATRRSTTARARRRASIVRRARRRSRCDAPRRGRQVRAADAASAHGGSNIIEIEADAAPGELTAVNNKAVRADRGHPREAARAARLGRAARGRADLAQPPEVRRQCRPRALHHPAPAREAGRHADQRAVADRLPDARAVREKINEFDLIIFDRYAQRSRSCRASTSTTSSAMSATAARVLVAAGPEFASRASLAGTPLAAVAPGDADRRDRRGALLAA